METATLAVKEVVKVAGGSSIKGLAVSRSGSHLLARPSPCFDFNLLPSPAADQTGAFLPGECCERVVGSFGAA